MKKNTKKAVTPLEDYATIENDLRASILDAYQKHGISQHKLGRAAGIHPIQIGWFIKGEKTLALPTITKLAIAVKKIEEERIAKAAEKLSKAPN